MECVARCFWSRAWELIFAAAVGAIVGLLLVLILPCLVVGGTLLILAGPFGPEAGPGAFITCSVVIGTVGLPVIIGAMVIVALLAAFIWSIVILAQCLASCSAAPNVGVAGAAGLALSSDDFDSCDSVTSTVTELESELERLRRERDEQQRLVDLRRRRVRNRRAAVAAAGTAVAATPFWDPVGALVAAAALVVALAALIQAQFRLAGARAELAALDARIAAAEAALRAAKAAKDAICRTSNDGPPTNPPTPTPPVLGGGVAGGLATGSL
jgi:hypothetical protein